MPPPVRRLHLQGLMALLLAFLGCFMPSPAAAQGVELATLQTGREDGGLTLEFAVRLKMPRAVEDALYRGVPVYFVAEAVLRRSRWYWRDQRVATVQRSWRIAFQPLTGQWRVGLGGLNQTYATLDEALASASRSAGWRLTELSRLDPDNSYYVQFSYRLDSSQLPGPMQFGLGGQSDWSVGISRDIAVEPQP